jgi:hypothetical protein
MSFNQYASNESMPMETIRWNTIFVKSWFARRLIRNSDIHTNRRTVIIIKPLYFKSVLGDNWNMAPVLYISAMIGNVNAIMVGLTKNGITMMI